MFLKTSEIIGWGEGKWTMNSNGLWQMTHILWSTYNISN
jgi:hypothetical protein